MTIPANTPPGTYPVTITGVGGGFSPSGGIATYNVMVTVDGINNNQPLRATDTGGNVIGYHLDLFNGAGKSACANYPNPMGVAACSPGGATCWPSFWSSSQ